MILLQAVLLGIVQGLTEFIPVSSSAHLIIVPWLLGWNDPVLESLSFDVALHLGTLVAVLVYFFHEWVGLARAGWASLVERRIGNDPERRLLWLLVLGVIPGAIAGVLGESKIGELFHPPNQPVSTLAIIALAVILALLGAVLYLAERTARHTRGLQELSVLDSIIIGLAQALAIFPGVSRSGATITAGLALRLERPAAARFSFLLSAPIIAGAGLKSLVNVAGELRSGSLTATDLGVFAVGMLAAAITGYFCIRFLLRYLQSHTTDLFVYYRWALAVILVLVALLRGR